MATCRVFLTWEERMADIAWYQALPDAEKFEEFRRILREFWEPIYDSPDRDLILAEIAEEERQKHEALKAFIARCVEEYGNYTVIESPTPAVSDEPQSSGNLLL